MMQNAQQRHHTHYIAAVWVRVNLSARVCACVCVCECDCVCVVVGRILHKKILTSTTTMAR